MTPKTRYVIASSSMTRHSEKRCLTLLPAKNGSRLHDAIYLDEELEITFVKQHATKENPTGFIRSHWLVKTPNGVQESYVHLVPVTQVNCDSINQFRGEYGYSKLSVMEDVKERESLALNMSSSYLALADGTIFMLQGSQKVGWARKLPLKAPEFITPPTRRIRETCS